jgi:hypothetical protein
MDYTNHYSKWSPSESIYKYLYIKVCDKNRDEDNQEYSFFLSLEKIYIIRNGLSITIGNVNNDFILSHYENSDADESYNRLCEILGIPQCNL